MIYTANWQLLEEYVDDDVPLDTGPSDIDRHFQNFWAPGSEYIDDLCQRRIDTDFDGDFDNTYFHLCDVQYSTRVVIDRTGDVIERVHYDAYGRAVHQHATDVDGDRDVDSDDETLVRDIAAGNNNQIEDITTGGPYLYRAEADPDRDGDIDLDDYALIGQKKSALPVGELSLPGVDNIIGWDGYVFNAETKMYKVRMREYHPVLGRWLHRDPLGTRPSANSGIVRTGLQYVDGANLYEFVSGKPLDLVDPRGLKACCGPEVDDWFAKDINLHSKFWKGWKAGPFIRPLYFKHYAKSIPYKWMDFGSDCPDDQGKGCAGTVRLCGVCIHKSELGNLMFGAMGKQWLRGERIIIAGGRRGGQAGGINTPEDLAGVLGGIFLEDGNLAKMSAASMCTTGGMVYLTPEKSS